MKNNLTLLFLIVLTTTLSIAQKTDSTVNMVNGFRNQLYTSQFGKGQIGGYAQIDFNQPFGNDIRENGTFDVHRLILFTGYRFNDRLSFFSEIEVEHVKEIYIEQAFLEYRLTNWMNLRAGMLLIPMGIVNEYHEPPTFNGVERPNLDKYIIPTTWREIGFGLAGNIPAASMNYQLYLVNGMLSYGNDEGLFNGKNGIRGGRQKGAKSTFSGTPNIAAKLNYYGFSNLTLGISGYFGKSQSTLYDGISKSDVASLVKADSSVVGIAMLGLDARYQVKALQLRGQFITASLSNTDQYNGLTGSDLGSRMMGYFVEAGYDILSLGKDIQPQLIIFSRYEVYNTHAATIGEIEINKVYNRTDITTGLHFKPSDRTSFKADYQYFMNEGSATGINQLNLGVGVWF